jgi:hypothetical protein
MLHLPFLVKRSVARPTNADAEGLRRLFHRACGFPSLWAVAPQTVTGIGWSDHWSFWQAGYLAVMVTDTAPYRYEHYHLPADTPDRLDCARAAWVVVGAASTVGWLAAWG